MYTEYYFPDVSFKQPTKLMPPITASVSTEVSSSTVEIGQYAQAFEIYQATMDMVRSGTGAELPIENRHISFVDMNTLKEAAKQKKLNESYGAYVLSGILGFTERNTDGSFNITIGVNSDGSANNFENTLLIAGHEYGHTIGPRLPDNVFEELKAYAFERLFARYLSPKNDYKLDDRYADNIHCLAGNMLNQLIERGFPPEAIISNLISQPFGAYKPDSNMQIPIFSM